MLVFLFLVFAVASVVAVAVAVAVLAVVMIENRLTVFEGKRRFLRVVLYPSQ